MASTSKNSCWWSNCLTREKCLALASIFACMALLNLIEGVKAFTINLTGSNVLPSHNGSANEINASTILNKIKNDVDPCSNFYEYACGKFIEETEIPENKPGVSQLTILKQTLSEQIKATITEETLKTEPKYFQLPNTLYKACMNKSLIQSLGTQHVQKIAESLGGWPVIVGNSWNSNNLWSWQETIKNFRRLGFNYNLLIHFSLQIDFWIRNSKPYMELNSAFTGLDENDLISGINNTVISAYYNKMVDIAVRFGAEKEAAKKALMESLQFQMDLAKIPLIRSNDLLTIKQLQQDYPQIDWLDYISSLLPEDVVINESDQISVPTPSYLKGLFNLLKGTDKRVIANYFMGTLYEFAVKFLETDKQRDRSAECMQMITKGRLSTLVDSLYIRKYIKNDSKTSALNIYNNLRAAFRQMLEKSQWMGDKTKHEAKRKLDAMTADIGFSEDLLDNDKLEKYYGKLQINSNNFVEAYLNMVVFNTDGKFSTLKPSANHNDWSTWLVSANIDVAYTNFENRIVLTAAVLQFPFFNAKLPNYMNYGGLGFLMGHEITHGFDSNSQSFDANGILNDWWHPATQTAFLENAKCIIEQYGNYTDKLTGLKLNGINTQCENIADNVGLKAAYLAYKQWVAANGEEPILPGLNYTARQMFWISAAQTVCAKYTKEKLEKIITKDVHSPNEFRVLGSFSNMQDFSNDFNCAERTPMNPTHKCEIW